MKKITLDGDSAGAQSTGSKTSGTLKIGIFSDIATGPVRQLGHSDNNLSQTTGTHGQLGHSGNWDI